MEITEKSRILAVTAHPDDVKSCTGVIINALKKNAQVFILGVTNGDGYQCESRDRDGAIAMGNLRKKEQLEFLQFIKVDRKNIFLLGYGNKGIPAMRDDFYKKEGPPHFDPNTQTDKVLYPDSYCPGAAYYGETVVGLIKEIIQKAQPTDIFTHHPKDDHPDHRAVYFFVGKALQLLRNENLIAQQPNIFSMMVYFKRLKWPQAGDSFLIPEIRDRKLFKEEFIKYDLDGQTFGLKKEACNIFVPTLPREYMDNNMKKDELFWRMNKVIRK